MSLDKAQRLILKKMGSGSHVLLAICLDVPTVPAWCDGRDRYGRAVCFVGKSQLGEASGETIAAVLDVLAVGESPETVACVAYAPKASAAIVDIVDGTDDEYLLDGERGTGKTEIVVGALGILAELHARAGYDVPIEGLWLHDSLMNAEAKTGQTLRLPLWQGLWALEHDAHDAVLTVAGKRLVHMQFVGCSDEKARERLRAQCHLVCAEELIPSLEEAGGIRKEHYGLALSSRRLQPNRRKVAICTTNPGDTDTWPYEHWLRSGGRPGTKRHQIPWTDRKTRAEHDETCRAFQHSPDLEARLGRGEWVGLKLGESVAEGYHAQMHVLVTAKPVRQDLLVAIGWDGGHSPSAVIGQPVAGQVVIYAALNDLKAGVLELIQRQVRPWLQEHAPWTVQKPLGWLHLVHIVDPNMKTGSEATILESAESMIRKELGGRIIYGPVRWTPRREAVLSVLGPRHAKGQTPLAICPGENTSILRKALGGRWYYPQTPDGKVDRTGPKKPNSPYADVGDAFANLCDWLLGSESPVVQPQEIKVETAFEVGAMTPGGY